jgi:hypothetical protein
LTQAEASFAAAGGHRPAVAKSICFSVGCHLRLPSEFKEIIGRKSDMETA